MAPKNRRYTQTDDNAQLPPTAPRDMVKQQLARNIFRRMTARGWNQSELAREADLGRDSVSTYIRGKVLPDPASLQKLADALDCKVTDLAPSIVDPALTEEMPAVELKQSVTDPRRAWLRVNREVSFATAAKVIEILQADNSQLVG